ncbi:MAG: NAD(P)-dependent oxidoreductase [Chloroflexi bacterium]|nr:NAD(P)-dependent oxidoreductase [Chloroflexota bacterium]
MIVVKKVGVIGLGTMGRPIARNIRKAGFDVAVYDLNPEAVAELVGLGATAAERPSDIAMGSDLVISVLPDGPDVLQTMLGEEGVYHAAREGMIHADFSTVHPKVSMQLYEAGKKRGVHVLDSAMARGKTEAENGTLVLMIGGEKEDIDAAMPVLSKVATDIHHCGPNGAGATMKLVNNLLGGVVAAVNAESLLLGAKAGLTPEIMYKVLSTTGANNAMLHGMIKNKVFMRNFQPPSFALDLQYKDARLALELGGDVGAALPIGALVQQLRTAARVKGMGRWDTSAIATVWEDLGGAILKASDAPGDD